MVDATAGRRSVALACRRLSPRRRCGSACASRRTTAPSTSASRSGLSSTSWVPPTSSSWSTTRAPTRRSRWWRSFEDPRISVHRNDVNVGSVPDVRAGAGTGARRIPPARRPGRRVGTWPPRGDGGGAADRRRRRDQRRGARGPARAAAMAAPGRGLAPVCGERRRGAGGGAVVLRLRDGAAPRSAASGPAVPHVADRVARPVDRPRRQRVARDAAPGGALGRAAAARREPDAAALAVAPDHPAGARHAGPLPRRGPPPVGSGSPVRHRAKSSGS